MAKSIMIQGTMSNVGKSILAGGLCRVLKQDGIRVAPFKSQNMALNSYITMEGLEMGRAQVMQAEAAGISPSVCMNPILLKPTTDTGSQVIVNGEVTQLMSAMEYFRRKREYIPAIMEAYHRLEESYDVIVIEGAGSPAEINLKENDIVNMGLAHMVNAPVLLAGDIDRGGVFAQIVGTIELLTGEERRRIKGTIINKFRGDKEILRPGLTMLEERTHIPVCGVVPYVNLDIDEEDSLTERFSRKESTKPIDIVVIRFPRISNFTDLAPLEHREEVSLRYVSNAGEWGEPDAVLLPGSKNTMDDLLWLRQCGLEGKILRFAGNGGLVFGICGGYQMLGEEISDPQKIERGGSVRGMGLLPMRTVFERKKTRTRVSGAFLAVKGILKELSALELEGYEIHMGESWILPEAERVGASRLVRVCDEVAKNSRSQANFARNGREREEKVEPGNLSFEGQNAPAVEEPYKKADGVQRGNVYGCYIHGIFDRAEVADAFVAALFREKGLDVSQARTMDYREYKEQQYDLLADVIRENLDMKTIYEIIEKGMEMPCSL